MKKFLGVFTIAAGLLFAGPALAAEDGGAVFKRGCAGCHGQNGERGTGGSEPIKGKSSADIKKMLLGYMDDSFGGKQKKTMQNAVKKLSAGQIQAVSDYVGGLK